MLTARRVLMLAAEYVQAAGLHKGDYIHKASGRLCALGAINKACYGVAEPAEDVDNSVIDETAVAALSDVIRRPNQSVVSVSGWNDLPRRRKHEVVSKLREAARTLPKP